jgi:predicted MFS family arabinose efflux permease
MPSQPDRYAAANGGEHTTAQAWYALSILIAAVLLAYVDRQIIALLVDSIRRDLALSDTQIGLLQGPAFAFFYAGAAIPLGWLVDRGNRRRLLIGAVLLWSVATAASGLSTRFSTLLLCRVGVALGEASLIPAVFSLLGDYFPPSRRATVFSVYMALILVGSSAAIAIGGMAVHFLEYSNLTLGWLDAPWRLAFVGVAAPGPFVALILLTLREPKRREQPSATPAVRGPRGGTRVLLIMGLAGSSATFQTLMAWLPSVLVRLHGWSAGSAGTALGLVSGAAAIFAAVTAAVIGRRHARRAALTAVLVCVLAAIPFAGALASLDIAIVFVATGLLTTSVLTAYALAPAILQAFSSGRIWGRVAALFKLAESVGIAVGATAVGVLSDHLSQRPGAIGAALAAALSCILAITAVILIITRRQVREV